jgi:hypothetical protein
MERSVAIILDILGNLSILGIHLLRYISPSLQGAEAKINMVKQK